MHKYTEQLMDTLVFIIIINIFCIYFKIYWH